MRNLILLYLLNIKEFIVQYTVTSHCALFIWRHSLVRLDDANYVLETHKL